MHTFKFAVITLPALLTVGCLPSTTEEQQDGVGVVNLSFDSTATSALSSRSISSRALTNDTITVTNSLGENSGTITLNETWIVISKIELEHENELTDVEQDVEFQGPFALDVLSGITYPALPEVEIDTGLYTDIQVKFEPIESEDVTSLTGLPEGVEDTLLNYSIYISGTYSSADGITYVDIPFTTALTESVEFEFTGEDYTNGFSVSDLGVTDLIIAFRMNDWFRFDLSETNSDSYELEDAIVDDRIDVSAEYFGGILNVIEENIELSAEYGEDDDDDGELDDNEDDDEGDEN